MCGSNATVDYLYDVRRPYVITCLPVNGPQCIKVVQVSVKPGRIVTD